MYTQYTQCTLSYLYPPGYTLLRENTIKTKKKTTNNERESNLINMKKLLIKIRLENKKSSLKLTYNFVLLPFKNSSDSYLFGRSIFSTIACHICGAMALIIIIYLFKFFLSSGKHSNKNSTIFTKLFLPTLAIFRLWSFGCELSWCEMWYMSWYRSKHLYH